MKKNLLIISIIIILIAMVYGAYYMISRRQDTTVNPAYFPKKEIIPKEYVMGGKVMEIKDNRITVTVELSTTTPSGTLTTTDTRVAIVASTTQYFATKYENRKYTKTKAKLSDIKVGNTISMYSNSNLVEMKSFIPYRIDIIK
ncbi:MAG: hypothetical protein WAW92_00535 [Minisyncoccia bacterium]